MIHFILAIGLTFLVSACASRRNAELGPTPPTTNEKADRSFQEAMVELEKENYARAAEILDRLLVQAPASQFDMITMFNSGVAHEGLGDCQKSAERYRQVAKSSLGKFPRIEAQALYRLSLSYECLGQDAKTITALLDARRRAKFLDPEVAEAALPARLAVAYGRMGQRDKALQFFNEASNGLKSIMSKSGNSKAQLQFATKTLYSMGQLTAQQRLLGMDPNIFMQALAFQQPYLLQAVELNTAPWSAKAADDLNFAFESAIKIVPSERAPAREYLQRTLQTMAEFKKIRLPGKGAKVDEIYENMEEQETKVRNRLVSLAEVTPLTPEAESREGLKRSGRVVGPKTELEKKKSTKK